MGGTYESNARLNRYRDRRLGRFECTLRPIVTILNPVASSNSGPRTCFVHVLSSIRTHEGKRDVKYKDRIKIIETDDR